MISALISEQSLPRIPALDACMTNAGDTREEVRSSADYAFEMTERHELMLQTGMEQSL